MRYADVKKSLVRNRSDAADKTVRIKITKNENRPRLEVTSRSKRKQAYVHVPKQPCESRVLPRFRGILVLYGPLSARSYIFLIFSTQNLAQMGKT